MKKIFLTSGLVLCMACPAFAANDINYTQPETPDGQGSYSAATCQEPTLGITEGSQTFNAKWTANTYHITYVGNTKDANGAGLVTQAGDTAIVGGTMGTDEQQSFVYAAATPLTPNAYSVAGYSFGGWQSNHTLTTVEGTGTPIYENQANINTYLYPNSDATLTAIWNPVASGTITLDSSVYPSNSHTGTATYTTSTDSNDRVTAPTSTSVHTVYNTAMYAGTEGTTALANNTPSKIGYTFGGFYGKFNANDANETEKQFIDETGNPTAAGKRAVNTANGTATWYANWSVNSHTIAYTCGDKPQGASATISGDTDSIAASYKSATYDDTYTLPTSAGTCALDGWHFAGWDCNYALGTITASTTEAAYGNAYAYANDAWTNNNGTGTFKVDHDVTCKAMWTQNIIGLNWVPGVGADTYSAGTGANSCIYDGDITVGAAPTRTGYTFTGWTTDTSAASNAGYVIFNAQGQPSITQPAQGD